LSGFEVEGGKVDFGESWGRKNRLFPKRNGAHLVGEGPLTLFLGHNHVRPFGSARHHVLGRPSVSTSLNKAAKSCRPGIYTFIKKKKIQNTNTNFKWRSIA
jgi:hypothetical protein